MACVALISRMQQPKRNKNDLLKILNEQAKFPFVARVSLFPTRNKKILLLIADC